MSDNIKVVVKVRPLIQRELDAKLSYQWRIHNDTLYQIDQDGKDIGQCFTFDKVYGEDTKTTDVYNDIAKPIVKAATAGINGTIFAYGQTSSGKTYTMSGTREEPGIIHQAVYDLFDIVKSKEDRDFLLRVSFIEIYNEQVKDLLNVKNEKIKIHETHQGSVRVDVTEKVISTAEEVISVMTEGELNRQIGATNMNEMSSRSHTIFQITIESRDHTDEVDVGGSVNISQLNLVDLAGSERAGQTGATGQRFKEGTHINKSLSALGLVIKQLSEDNSRFANYRDSKLTRILQNSLGGNAKTSIICAVTPAALDETISTLQFANRAKAIKNKPEVNAVATNASMIQRLTKQLAALQTQLESKKNIEEDMKIIKEKFASLKKQIINGFVRPPDFANQRKTWGKARRVTIDVPRSHDHFVEPETPRFCTPGLKYNPLLMPGVTEFVPIQKPESVRLPCVTEEARSPPTVIEEVIEIDSDDDEIPSQQSSGCSPYHKCHGSKTPPCALRERATVAEKNYKCILKLTEREKLYQPSVIELMEKLEQNTTVISKLEEKVESLKKQCDGKEGEIDKLRLEITKAQDEIKTSNTEKTDLETRCGELQTQLTDMEVSYETLKRKSKSREDDLLSLLEEQKAIQNKRNGKLTKPIEKEINFMDLSTNISLVNSDNESSIIAKDYDTQQVQDMLLTDLQSQITSKNQLITELEAELAVFKDKISHLETSNGNFQSNATLLNNEVENLKDDKSNLMATVETLKLTIKTQKENLDAANKDIEAYNELMKEMQAKLQDVSSQVLNESALETIMATEEQLISNNESFKKIIESLKSAILTKNEEIDRLKASLNNAESDNARGELEKYNAKMEELLGETNRLNQKIDQHIETINKLTNENANIHKSKEHLAMELTEALKIIEEANKLKGEMLLANKDLSAKVEEMIPLIEELEKSIDTKDNMITYLQDNDKTKELMTALNSAVVRIQNTIKSLTGKDIEIGFEDKSNAEFTPLNNALSLLESTHNEVKQELKQIRDNREKLLHTLEQHMNAEMDGQIRYDTLLKNYNDLTIELQRVNGELAENSERFDDFNKSYQALSNTVEEYRITKETFQKKETEMTNELENQKKLLQEITLQYESLKKENERLLKATTMTHDETLSSKDVEISELKDKLLEMEMELQKLKCSLISEGQKADEKINSLEQILQSILDNVINLANSNSIEHQLIASEINREDIFKQIPLALDAIVDGLKCIYNKDSNAQIEIIQNALSESEYRIKDLTSKNKQLESELKGHNRQYQEYLGKVNTMEKDNEVLNKDLTHCNDLIESLKQEIHAKKDMLGNMEVGTREWKEKFASLEQTFKDQIQEMQQEKSDLLNKYSSQEAKGQEYLGQSTNKISAEMKTGKTPESLLSMCCSKIVDALSLKEDDYKLTPTSSDTTICQCYEMASKLQQSEEKIYILKNAVKHFKTENERLIEEHENVRKEVEQIVQPADELLKRLATHKTHLATLTNTTYAETRLLKSQVKSLEHHHGNLHNVCQRDIQKLKKQLRELYLFLQTEHEKSSVHNSSFKRYSLPIILDSNMTLPNLKNESTLDGDLLMLDTNVTLASTDNTLTCHDQTCHDMTQAYAHNESCPDGSLAPISMELLMEDNKKMIQKLNLFSEENRRLKEQLAKPLEMSEMRNSSFIDEPVKILITPCDDAVCKSCQDKDHFASDVQKLSDELVTIKAEKTDLEEKYNNLQLEVPSSEKLIGKLNAFENDLVTKEKLITKLKHDIEAKSRQIDQLQEENDTLSTQIMDNITEVDDLKKELDQLKSSNKDLVVKCEGLEKLTKLNASKIDFGTPNKLLSNSEVLNTSQSNSDTSRHILFNTLQNQLHASREDCKKITEALSFGQKMDLDDSMGESNIFNFTKDFDSAGNQSMSKFHTMPAIPEERALEYSTDRTDCLSYFLEKTGANKENFQHELKIIDIMKMLYNNLETIHANDVQNLTNKLRHFEENKNALETQISDLTAKHSSLCEELEKHMSSAKIISHLTSTVKSSIDALTVHMSSGDAESNTTFVVQFKEDILRKIDTGLSLNTADVFETLLDKIAIKHQNDLTSINEQYTKLLQHMEGLATELTSVNENVAQMKEQLQSKEDDYNLLKAQKEKMHEISNAVTLDIVKKEQALSETITQGCKQLIEYNIMNPDEIDFTSSMNKNVQTIFERLIKQSVAQNQNSELENEKQKLELEVKNSASLLQEKAYECDSLSTEIAKLKSTNAELKLEIEVKISAIKTNNDQLEDMKEVIHRLRNQIECNEKIIKTLESEQNERMDSDDLSDWMQKASALETENNRLRKLQEEIEKQREEYAFDLEKAGKDIQNYKTDIGNMSAQIKELQNSLETKQTETKEILDVNNNLRAEKEEFLSKLEELGKQYEEKNQECASLKLHIKTNEKTTEIQSKIILRLKSQKEEDNKTIAEKEYRIAELQKEIETSKAAILELQTLKDTLEIRLSELENEAKDGQKGKTSLEAVSSNVRRRRQSSHDTKRMVDDRTDEDHDGKLEALFAARPTPDELFADGHSSGRSTPLGRRRDSLLRESAEESPPSRAGSAARRRRQSLHDAGRGVNTPEPTESRPKSSETADMSEPELRERISFLEKENEELREKYREVDEECDTCAQYLREREEQCARLKEEVIQLEKTIGELRSQDSTVCAPRGDDEPKRGLAHVAVNTDEDWSNLHSVVVDRMSFDLEVDKNKKMRKAIEEFRMKNRDLRATVGKLQGALERHAAGDGAKELEKLKEELSSLKQENQRLSDRNSELDDECNTFEAYLRERDDAIARLKMAKAALEAKLEEVQGGSKETAQSARKKRQSLYDQNRDSGPALRDACAETCDEPNPKSSETADMSEPELRERISYLEKEIEELREKYREVDEECDTCAQYLREREEQCARLKEEVMQLEKTICDLRSQDGTVRAPRGDDESQRGFASAGVNTDEDWSNLHSVVVDRMSFDLEVDKNKKMRKAIEEFRMKNRDLRATVGKLQGALERHAAGDGAKELEKLKEELSTLKQENQRLSDRNSELDDECNTFEAYLRERDDAIARLKVAKAALEAKLEEVQGGSKETAQSARKKRQSLYDQNRDSGPALRDVCAETCDDLLSYQVERDTSSRLSVDFEAQSKQIATLNMTINKLSTQKAELEKRLAMSSGGALVCVATGSAIVQNQQLTDLFKENQKLKKQNAKLVDLCKKRGKTADSDC